MKTRGKTTNYLDTVHNTQSDFLADVSHEIRTPISAIIGLGHILLSTELDFKQRQCVTVLQDSAEALLAMVNRTLDISKIASRNPNLEIAPFNLALLLTRIVGIMSIKAREKNIDLTLHYETTTPQTFVGDSGCIRQIVMNLVGNAIKFTAMGGVTVTVASGKNQNEISISVADTGLGIAEDKIGSIFDRFAQADSSISRKYGGTGLGLSISKALAENMEGTIVVKSVLGKGSTFILNLRLPTGEDHDHTEPQHAENVLYLDVPMKAKKFSLMLADDYETYMRGYQV